ncbi:NPCBM/NEW2 domain-containing protein [Sphingosinicella sp. BN140058]|uniref:NPCBM/NEW2 domain-containing protein n=1 Tax=Sphingosinicella sp. BN140058 TaxID=1892855 RepID=UPI0010125D91|nr:NPCBM/NEW2 domain-containing protein [Sphingosinicella sp. BN140058]QAY79786.1 alpha-galactosidase [Sphingosinicella sp. BN140058]
MSFVLLAGMLALSVPAWAAPDPLAPSGRWSANSDGHAPVPPMGWNSWNAFNSDVDEEKVLASAQALVDTGLARLGYRYVNIDDGWWLKRRESDGRLIIRTAHFPSAATGPDPSFRPLTDRLHAMGLKAGIYSDIGRNSCGQIYTPDFKNQPEGSLAEREVGLYGHVDQDIRLFFAEWNFDLIKVDGCGVRGLPADAPRVRSGLYRALPPLVDMQSLGGSDVAGVRKLYTEVGEAIRRHSHGRPYVYSLCLWGAGDVRSWGKDVGNMSRTSDDIQPLWGRMLTNLDTVTHRALYAHPGSWNDADMLFVGTGDFDQQHGVEARSHFSLWAMLNSPLIIGYDLRKLRPQLLAIFGNAEVVALNQDPAGNQAVLAYDSGEVQIFVKTLADGSKAVALFNRTGAARDAILTADHLKMLPSSDVRLRDLWSKEERSFRGETKMQLAAHETRLFRVSGDRRLADGLYLSEQPGRINPAVDGIPAPLPDPTIHPSITPWVGTRGGGEHVQYGGWGGAEPDRAPYGKLLRVAGKSYDTGIGVLAGSRLEVRNAGFSQFAAMVGVNDSGRRADGPVVFEVWGDGKLLARSAAMRFGAAAAPIKADIAKVRIVELVARASGGTRTSAMPQPATWAEAALLK